MSKQTFIFTLGWAFLAGCQLTLSGWLCSEGKPYWWMNLIIAGMIVALVVLRCAAFKEEPKP